MSMFYLPLDAEYIKQQRMEREPEIELHQCADGLWRTLKEKKEFDAHFFPTKE